MADIAAQLGQALRDRYALERELGRGGMATVYLARDIKHERLIALKVLHPELAATVGSERFLREIRTAARLQHPHILTVLDSGDATGLLWYAMPYVQGESLRDRLRREGELPIPEVVRILREVADALAYAHAQALIHRDIKPENVLLAGSHAFVADFGVAKALSAAASGRDATSAGLALGTPAYMAPEQAAGDPHLDNRADLYALGVVAYEMLAGVHPFAGRPQPAMLAAHATETPDPVQRRRAVAEPLATLVMCLLEKRPADRRQSASEVLHALEEVSVTRGGLEPTHASQPPPDRSPGGLTWQLVALAVLVVLLIAGFAWWGHVRHSPAAAAPTMAATTPRAPIRSVAVLPFVNMSADPDKEYFSDGITEELINALSKVGGLEVAARTSSFAFKGKTADVTDIGRQLNVGAVLEGSVRRAGRRVRVTAQLIDASTGYHLWSESYDRELADVFALEDELSRAIVAQLEARLGSDTGPAIVRRATPDVEAYDLYLRGRYYWSRGGESSLRTAIDYFERALARDSTFALAYSGLADSWFRMATSGYVPPGEAFPRGKAAAIRALSLDSTLAEAHVSVASLARWFDHDRPLAKRELAGALALNPRYPEAWVFSSWLTLDEGDVDRAVRDAQHAVALDPLSVRTNSLLGYVLSDARRYEEAVVALRRALELDSTAVIARRWLGSDYIRVGRIAEGMAQYERASTERLPAELMIASGHAVAGDRAEARRAITLLQNVAQRSYVRPDYFATLYMLAGDHARALSWLERAEREHALPPELKMIRTFDPLHGHPRFMRLIRKLGLEA